MTGKTQKLQSEGMSIRHFFSSLANHGLSDKKAISNQATHSIDIAFYDINTLNDLTCDPSDEIAYLKDLIRNGTSHYFDNLSAEVAIIKVRESLFPILVSSGRYDNSYVCSPYGHYISLAIESLFLIKNRWLKKIVKRGLETVGLYLKFSGINPAVYFNHSLFSTDLQPNTLSKSDIENIVVCLKEKYPKHTLIFRSLNPQTTHSLQHTLKTYGFDFIASKGIYLTESTNPELFKTRIIKSDLKHWNENDYEVISQENFTLADEERILELYRSLSIDYHSKFNPMINKNFIKLLKDHPILKIKALKKNGRIDGFVGYQIKEKTLLCTLIGYDRNQEIKTDIYRQLSTLLFLEATKNAEVFHQSSGASFYKSIRRAKFYIEYQGIYTKHLRLKQRVAWCFLRGAINTLATPLMKKY